MLSFSTNGTGAPQKLPEEQFNQQDPPGRSRGLLAWLSRFPGLGWLGPRLSYEKVDTPDGRQMARPGREVEREKVAGGPRGVTLPWFLPYIQSNYTNETTAMRLAYRYMLSDPTVKSALLSKILSVAALDLKVQPVDKKNALDRQVAEFVQWCLTERLRDGIPGLVWSVLSGGLIDGYSVCEEVLDQQHTGKWAGHTVLRELKPKDTLNDLVLLTDAYRNVVGVQGMRYNAGEVYSPSIFLIWRHLPLFCSPTGMSDLRAVYSRYWMLDTVLKLRAMGLDKRSLPMLVGWYPMDNPAVQSSVEAALEKARSQSWLAVPDGVKIDAVNIAGMADAQFSSAVADLREDIVLGITGATLQVLTGGVGEQRGSSKVHESTANKLVWHLAASIESCLNDYDTGLVKDLVDLNYVVSDYPRATLSAVDLTQLQTQLQIDMGLHSMVALDREELYETYSKKPPNPDDPDAGVPPAGGPPPGMGGPLGAQPPNPLGFSEDGPDHDWEAMSDSDWSSFAAEDWAPWTLKAGKNKGKSVWKNQKTGAISHENPAGKAKKREEATKAKQKAAAKPQEKAPEKPAKKAKLTHEQVTEHAKGVLAKPTPSGVLEMVDNLLSLSKADMQKVAAAIGAGKTGTKSELAKKVAAKVEQAKPKPEPSDDDYDYDPQPPVKPGGEHVKTSDVFKISREQPDLITQYKAVEALAAKAKPSQVHNIPISHLNEMGDEDGPFQKEINTKIAKHYRDNPGHAPAVVIREDGKDFILEGRHRALGAKMRGDDTVRAVVIEKGADGKPAIVKPAAPAQPAPKPAAKPASKPKAKPVAKAKAPAETQASTTPFDKGAVSKIADGFAFSQERKNQNTPDRNDDMGGNGMSFLPELHHRLQKATGKQITPEQFQAIMTHLRDSGAMELHILNEARKMPEKDRPLTVERNGQMYAFGVIKDKGKLEQELTKIADGKVRLPEAKPAPSTPAPEHHPQAVVDAMRKIDTKGDNMVSLADLRQELAKQGISDRAAQDAAIKHLRQSDIVEGMGYEGRQALADPERTKKELAASIKEGDRTVGYLKFRPGKRDAAVKPEPKVKLSGTLPVKLNQLLDAVGQKKLTGDELRDHIDSLEPELQSLSKAQAVNAAKRFGVATTANMGKAEAIKQIRRRLLTRDEELASLDI